MKAAHDSAFLVCRAGYQHLLTWLLSMSQLSSLIIQLSSTLCPFLTSVQLQTPTPTSPTLCELLSVSLLSVAVIGTPTLDYSDQKILLKNVHTLLEVNTADINTSKYNLYSMS